MSRYISGQRINNAYEAVKHIQIEFNQVLVDIVLASINSDGIIVEFGDTSGMLSVHIDNSILNRALPNKLKSAITFKF